MDLRNKFKGLLWVWILIPICIVAFIIISRKAVIPSNEDIVKYLQTTKEYSSDVEYTFINSKGEYKENTIQYYNKDDGMRVEFKDEDGRVKIYTGSDILMIKKEGQDYTIDKNIDEIYPLAFIENILCREDYICSHLEVIKPEWSDNEYIKMTIDYPKGNRHIDKGEFYIDKKNKCPVLLRIFDDNDKERIIISYKNFKTDKHSDEKIF